MYDQAHKLKQIKRQRQEIKKTTSNAKVYCITSGKGGVGKTNISVNLALTLQDLGKKVLLVDADLGLANIDVVAGIYPKYNLSHILNSGKLITDVLTKGPRGITILSGASGLCDMADIAQFELNILIKAFEAIAENYDILIIDTGAGISKNVLSFVKSADEVIVVTTPEPSSITDAYAMIKLIYSKVEKINIIVNRASRPKEADFTARKICNVAEKYLKANNIYYIGYILDDKTVSNSNMHQIPFYIKYPKSAATKCIKDICHRLLFGEKSLATVKTNPYNWLKRFLSIVKKEPGGR